MNLLWLDGIAGGTNAAGRSLYIMTTPVVMCGLARPLDTGYH